MTCNLATKGRSDEVGCRALSKALLTPTPSSPEAKWRGAFKWRAWPETGRGSRHGRGLKLGGASAAGRGLRRGPALAPGGAGGGGGEERSPGEETGCCPRGGSESPDRRLPPAVGPRGSSAPVSGSDGLRSFRPSPGSPGLVAGGRAGLEGAGGLRSVYALRGLSGLAVPAPPCTALRGPRPAPPAAGGKAEPTSRPADRRSGTSRRSELPFVAAWRTFVI